LIVAVSQSQPGNGADGVRERAWRRQTAPAIIDIDIPAEIPQIRRRGATRVGDDATVDQFSYF
jgi:hypothetical protein